MPRKTLILIGWLICFSFPVQAMNRFCAFFVGHGYRSAARLLPSLGFPSLSPTFTVSGMSHHFHLNQATRGTIGPAAYLRSVAQHLRPDPTIVFEEEFIPGAGHCLVFSPEKGTSEFNQLARKLARLKNKAAVCSPHVIQSGAGFHYFPLRLVNVDSIDISDRTVDRTEYILPGVNLAHKMEMGQNASRLNGALFAMTPRSEKLQGSLILTFHEIANSVADISRLVDDAEEWRHDELKIMRVKNRVAGFLGFLDQLKEQLAAFDVVKLKARVGVVAENPLFSVLRNGGHDTSSATFPSKIEGMNWLVIRGDELEGRAVSLAFPTRLLSSTDRSLAEEEARGTIESMIKLETALRMEVGSIYQALEKGNLDIRDETLGLVLRILSFATEPGRDSLGLDE